MSNVQRKCYFSFRSSENHSFTLPEIFHNNLLCSVCAAAMPRARWWASGPIARESMSTPTPRCVAVVVSLMQCNVPQWQVSLSVAHYVCIRMSTSCVYEMKKYFPTKLFVPLCLDFHAMTALSSFAIYSKEHKSFRICRLRLNLVFSVAWP